MREYWGEKRKTGKNTSQQHKVNLVWEMKLTSSVCLKFDKYKGSEQQYFKYNDIQGKNGLEDRNYLKYFKINFLFYRH